MATPLIQSGINCDIIYGPELTFGTRALANLVTAQKIRKVQSTLAPAAAQFQSQEYASHQQVADLRHGMKSCGGAISGELSNATYDDWFEAVMRGTWTTGATTGSSTIGADNPSTSITRAAGSFITDGFKIGDIVRATGYAGGGAANNNVNYRITALTALNMTVAGTPAPATIAGAAGVTISVINKKLLMGTTKRSFTIEQVYNDIDESEIFDSTRIIGAQVRCPPNGMATCSFNFLGLSMARILSAASPYFSAPVAETTTNLFAGPNGVIRVNGADSVVATAWELNINGNFSNQPVIGSLLAPDIFPGVNVATGSFSAYFESGAYADAFLLESEVDVSMFLNTVDTTPSSYLNFVAQRVKLMGVQKTLTPQGGVIATYPWQALRKIGGAATVYDTSTLFIQRSN